MGGSRTFEKACWELMDDRSRIMEDRYVFIVESWKQTWQGTF